MGRWVSCSSGSRKHVFDVAGGCVEHGGGGLLGAGDSGLWVPTGHGATSSPCNSGRHKCGSVEVI